MGTKSIYISNFKYGLSARLSIICLKTISSDHAESLHLVSERGIFHSHSCDEISLWSLADSGTLVKNCGNIDLNSSK